MRRIILLRTQHTLPTTTASQPTAHLWSLTVVVGASLRASPSTSLLPQTTLKEVGKRVIHVAFLCMHCTGASHVHSGPQYHNKLCVCMLDEPNGMTARAWSFFEKVSKCTQHLPYKALSHN